MSAITKFSAKDHSNMILSIGKSLFDANDVSLLEKALKDCSPEYSRVYTNVNNNVIGFALVRKRDPIVETYELAFLGVDVNHQGKGIASKLLRQLDMTQPSNSSCWLLVNQDNTLAQNMYSKFGFHILCDCFDSFMTPCFIMIKNREQLSPTNSPLKAPSSPQPPPIQLY